MAAVTCRDESRGHPHIGRAYIPRISAERARAFYGPPDRMSLSEAAAIAVSVCIVVVSVFFLAA